MLPNQISYFADKAPLPWLKKVVYPLNVTYIFSWYRRIVAALAYTESDYDSMDVTVAHFTYVDYL